MQWRRQYQRPALAGDTSAQDLTGPVCLGADPADPADLAYRHLATLRPA
jgi:hypothetical protein